MAVEFNEPPEGILVHGILVVERKAVEAVLPVHVAQVISYLKVVGGKLGLLFNFNAAVMKNGVKRVVMSWSRCGSSSPGSRV